MAALSDDGVLAGPLSSKPLGGPQQSRVYMERIPLSTLEVIAFMASVASLVLAILAIWLSIAFFRMSTDLSARTTEAAEDIGSSVQKLEALFERLYADTFSMMRETVSDMRRHIWPDLSPPPDRASEELELKADQKVAELKAEMHRDVSQMLERQKITDKQVTSIQREVQNLLDKAILASRHAEIEAREETLRAAIIRLLTSLPRSRRGVRAEVIVDHLSSRFPTRKIVSEIEELKNEGLVTFPELGLSPSSLIKVAKKSD